MVVSKFNNFYSTFKIDRNVLFATNIEYRCIIIDKKLVVVVGAGGKK